MYNRQSDCGIMLKQINDIMEKHANNALREQEITLTQAGMLIELNRRGDNAVSFKELEKIFGVSQPTIVGILKRLEQKGFVRTINDKDDRRIKKACLTEEGRKKCDTGYSYMAEAENFLLGSLSSEEKDEFARLLNKIRNSMNEN